MIPRDFTAQRLTALAALGALLLTPPLIWLVDHPARIAGVPVLYLWAFGVWALLIGLMALVVERRSPAPPTEPGG
jgi:peptidoglycan/LPS O-acetylase OafA/YrhL